VGTYGQYRPAFRWTAGTGAVDIGSVSQNPKISRDGKVIAGDEIDSTGITTMRSGRAEHDGKRWEVLQMVAFRTRA
jgi:hypothetical protein